MNDEELARDRVVEYENFPGIYFAVDIQKRFNNKEFAIIEELKYLKKIIRREITMEIVKHGRTHQKYTCETCGCEFYACKLDKRIRNDLLIPQSACPECGEPAIKSCFFYNKNKGLRDL